ncbi:glycoprotein [Bangoran virus]|uniref:glycoprotein n=1 Tax=Bangoran virus TaxID=864693 RepID=UPI002481CC45|nr:glycoprotein [Bangoran virus]UAX43325.1 glycoprotein [Bangoran virus]
MIKLIIIFLSIGDILGDFNFQGYSKSYNKYDNLKPYTGKWDQPQRHYGRAHEDFGKYRIVLPTLCNDNWQGVHANSLVCPSRRITGAGGLYNVLLGESWHPHVGSGTEVNGYLCQKTTWISKCEETWYFTTYKTTRIEETDITEEECLAAITALDSGQTIEPFFPPFSCSWNMINENPKDFVTVHSHPVVMDIYDNSLIDPLFDGKCKSKVCNTKHGNLKWIEGSDKERNDICEAQHWETSYIYGDADFDEGNNFVSLGPTIDSDLYGPRDLKGACITNICGIDGIRFEHGEWWGFHTISHLLDWTRFLRRCSNNITVGFSHDSWGVSELIEEITYRDHRCIDIVSKLASKERISPFELSYLVQDYPGEGYAYRAFNVRNSRGVNTKDVYLERKVCKYHVAYLDKLVFNKTNHGDEVYIVGTWGNGYQILLNKSEIGTNSTRGLENGTTWRILMSFNGIMRFGDQLVFPQAAFFNHPNVTGLFEKHSFKLVEHPLELLDTGEDDLHTLYKFYNRSNSTSVVPLVTRWFKGIGSSVSSFFTGTKNLIWWIVTLLISGLATLIALKLGLFSWIKKKILAEPNKKTKHNIYEEPLQLGKREMTTIRKNPFFD